MKDVAVSDSLIRPGAGAKDQPVWAGRNLGGGRPRIDAQRGKKGTSSAPTGLWMLGLLPIVVIPFENQLKFDGISIAKFTVVPLLIGVLISRPKKILETLRHPVALAFLGFILWGALVELFHPFRDFELHSRIFQMFGFGVLMASLLSTRVVLSRTLIGLVIVCSVLSIYLIFNFYGLVRMNVLDSEQAGLARVQAFQGMSLEANLNHIGYAVGMGAVVALCLLLSTKKAWQRVFWAVVSIFCVTGSTITASRGAFIAVALAFGVILWRSLRTSVGAGKLAFAFLVVVCVYFLLPNVLSTRLSATLGGPNDVAPEKQEARQRVLSAAVNSIPEYWALGVGVGNYWEDWGVEHGFYARSARGRSTLGPHSGFFAA